MSDTNSRKLLDSREDRDKLRLHQLTGKDPAETIVLLSNDEISSLWNDNEYWQIALTNFLGTISNNYPKTDRIKFIKKTVWILPRIVRQTSISGVLIFYTDANKSGEENLWIPSKLIKIRVEKGNPLDKDD
ncbi:putative HERV-K-19q12 provirus ancestral Pol protein [Cricetulus griseus]|nr:putative HERV-K-19q12 provirus ancestral Pol protein [Cricetulus griseus]